MIRLVAAISLDRAIGVYEDKKGKLPWDSKIAKGDLEYFKNLTSRKSVVIMGRKTFESIGSVPLENRKNIVISSRNITNHPYEPSTLVFYGNLRNAIGICNTIYISPENWNIWLIGGERIFSEGMEYADEIILTIIPFKAYEHFDTSNLVYFPNISRNFVKVESSLHPINPELRIIKYRRSIQYKGRWIDGRTFNSAEK